MAYLLFDLDGTLVDSSLGIKNAFHHAFTQLGIPIPDNKILSSFIGPPLETTFAYFLGNEDEAAKAITVYRDYYQARGIHEVKLYQDIPETLAQLSQKHTLFVTTSKLESMAQQMLSDLAIDTYFTAIYGSTPNRFLKADIITHCLKNHFIPKKQASIIGDTRFDIIGGKEVGIACVGVTWGFGTIHDLQEQGADQLIHHPQELLTIF